MAKGEKLPVVMASQVGQPSGVAGLDESGKVPHAQLPAMGYIPTTEKGQPGGVATLGPDGKVPGEQLPDICLLYTSCRRPGGSHALLRIRTAGRAADGSCGLCGPVSYTHLPRMSRSIFQAFRFAATPSQLVSYHIPRLPRIRPGGRCCISTHTPKRR